MVLNSHWCLAVAVSAMFLYGMYGSVSICKCRNKTANESACMFVMCENWLGVGNIACLYSGNNSDPKSIYHAISGAYMGKLNAVTVFLKY